MDRAGNGAREAAGCGMAQLERRRIVVGQQLLMDGIGDLPAAVPRCHALVTTANVMAVTVPTTW